MKIKAQRFIPVILYLLILEVSYVFTQSSEPGVWWSTGPRKEASILKTLAEPGNIDRLYSLPLAKPYLLYSDNKGLTWSQKQFPEGITASDMICLADTIIVSADRGIFLSSNNGDSWSVADASVDGLSFSKLIGNESLLFALEQFGSSSYKVHYSTDRGQSWQTPGFTSGLFNSSHLNALLQIDSILYAATGTTNYSTFPFGELRTGVFYSLNNGQRWQALPAFNNIYATGLYMFDETFIVSSSDGLYMSPDSAKSWQYIKDFNHFIFTMIQFEDKIIAGGPDGIFYSSDKGQSWQKADMPGFEFIINPLSITHFTVFKDMIIAGTANWMLLQSFDGGESWQECNPPMQGLAESQGTASTSVSHILLTDSTLFASSTLGLYRSQDGIGWFKREQPVYERMDLTYIDDQIIIAGGVVPQSVYNSFDGGISWSPTNARSLWDILKLPGKFLMGSSSLYESLDGINWDVVNFVDDTTSAGTDCLFQYNDVIFAGTDFGLYTSSDFGVSWQLTDHPVLSSEYVAKIMLIGDKLILQSENSLYISHDGGSNWQTISIPFFSFTYYGIESNGRLIIQVYDESTATEHIFYSDDAGITWQMAEDQVFSEELISSIISFNGRLYAGAGSVYSGPQTLGKGLFISEDNGQSWTKSGWFDEQPITDLKIIDGWLYASGTSVYRSKDGDNWINLNKELGTSKIFSLNSYSYQNSNRLFAATDNGIWIHNIDLQAPLASGLSLLNQDNFSADQKIALLLDGEDADSMIISEDSTFANAAWQAYNQIVEYELSAQDGEKTIYAGFKDFSWNESNVIKTNIILDSTPPEFAEHSLPASPSFGDNIDIEQQVSDANLQQVSLYYRRVGETFSADRRSVFVDNNARIDSLYVTNRGLDYRIVATDFAGQSDTLKNGSIDFFSLPVTLQKEDLGSSPGFPGGTEGNAFRIVSLPMQLQQALGIEDIVGDLGSYGSKGDWLLWDYQGVGNWIDGRQTEIDNGKGYFLLLRDGQNFTNQVNGISSKISDGIKGNIYGWQLRGDDWTIIGNPYNTRIDLSLLKLKNYNKLLSEADTSFQVWAYDGRQENNGWINQDLILEPWGGLAVYVNAPDTIVFANANDPFVPLSSFPKNPATVDYKDEWYIQIKAGNDYYSDNENFLGVKKDATKGRDSYDGYEPPLLPGAVSLSFVHEKEKFSYASDIRPLTDDGHSWQIHLAGDPQNIVDLDFNWSENIAADFKIYLKDETSGLWRDLQLQNKLQVNIPEQGYKDFTLLVGNENFLKEMAEDLEIIPHKFQLFQNYPNPFNPATTIRYGLPSAGEVTLKIFDVLGREVATLLNKRVQQAGYYETVVDFMDLSSGVYFYTLTLSAEQPFYARRKMIFLK